MRFILASGIAAACVVTSVSVATAQPEERLRQGVLERDRPAYAAKGIRAGSFLLYPALDLSAVYDDNIYATDGNEEGDFIIQTRPQLRAETNLPQHAFWFRGDVLTGTYLDNSDENRVDWYVGGGSRIDATRATNWNTDIEYQKDTEDRGSPDASGAADEPVSFRRFQADSSVRFRPGRFNITGGGIFENYDFDDVGLISGGTQNNDDRDRDVYAGYARLGYEASPGYELFLLGLYAITNYDSSLDDNGFNRDSHGYQLEGGARFEITNVISGEASVGYLSRDYFDNRLPGISGISTEMRANWFVTRLTTLTFGASRRVQETTLNDAAGYLDTVFDAGIDHELMRNLILSGNLRYGERDYEGISRTDDHYEAMARALYLINRNYSIAGEYRYYNRDSSAATEDYVRNLVMLTFRVQI